ncbi:hypothetical protein Lal_00024204 [Lupinus albus]|nr:hypothetical protein Lal_00024204 [Lupinus albus]
MCLGFLFLKSIRRVLAQANPFSLKRESHTCNRLPGLCNRLHCPKLPFLAEARQLSLRRESSSIAQDFTLPDFGFMFPEFLKNQGVHCKNGVYQTMVKNIFIILDEDLLVDVGGLGRFDHPYGYFEEKLLSAFEPVRAYKNMLRDSQRHQATSKPIVSALAVEHRLLYTLLVYCLAPRDLHHDDQTEVVLYLMFALKENVRIDWPHLILLNMLGFSTSSGAFGYPILISRIIEHALVDVSDNGYLITNP